MKKIIFGMMALAAFTGCDGDYEDWAAPQTYPQVDPLTINVAIASTATNINMNTDADRSIDLFSLTNDNSEITGFDIDVILLGDTIEGTYNEGKIYVEANDVERVVALYNNSNTATTYSNIDVTADVSPTFEDGDALYFSATRKLDVTLAGVPEYTGGYKVSVESAEVGSLSRNSDGTYSCLVQTTENNSSVLFSAVTDDGSKISLGTFEENNTSTTGVIAVGEAAYGIVIPAAGPYSITLDIVNGTYTIKSVALFYSGDANGWGFSPMCRMSDGLYVGYYQIYEYDGENNWGFKFPTADNWDEPQYGWSDQGADHIALGGGNLNLPDGYSSGFYQITVNTAELTYSLQLINTVSIVGDVVGHDTYWKTDIDMTYNPTEYCWTATNVTLNAGLFKFRADHAWTISWGSDGNGALTSANGGNLAIDADGTYTIKFWPNCDGEGVYTIE